LTRRGPLEGEVSEPEGLADVLAGGAEDLAVDVDQAVIPAMSALPSDGTSHCISPRVADALVQIEVAHRVRDDR
jgi:hypothetical protein